MPILQLPNGIRIAGSDPIDSDRYIAVDASAQDQLITDGRAYEGLLSFDSSTKTLKILNTLGASPVESTWAAIASGISEAPVDGSLYGRIDAGWGIITPPISYTFKNGITEVDSSVYLGGVMEDQHYFSINGRDVSNGYTLGVQFGRDGGLQPYSPAFKINSSDATRTGWLELTPGGFSTAAFQDTDSGYINILSESVDIGYNDGDLGNIVSVNISNIGSIILRDESNLKGAVYHTDYSANGLSDDKWIPDVSAVKMLIDACVGGGIDEAPTDGSIYGRIDTSWTVIADSSSAGVYNSDLDDGITMSEDVGGFTTGTTVGDLRGTPYDQMWDTLLFPTVLAYVQTVNSASLNLPGAATVEVGSSYAPAATGTYIPGVINNGDDTSGPNLTGDASNFIFKLPDGTIDQAYVVSGNSQAHTFTVYDVEFGSNTWTVQVDYDAGSGTYTDNKGTEVTNLDAQRIADSRIGSSGTVLGRRYVWYDAGTTAPPTNSTGVRGITNKQLLSSTNTGTFDITIPATNKNVYFFAPAGKTVSVIYLESFDLDVTAEFTTSSITVNDAGGTGQTYTSYVSIIGGSGYTDEATYRVTIS